MQVGLFTIYQVPNYGSVLQTYATQCVLEQQGHVCSIINYIYPNEWHWSQGARRPNRIKTLIRKFIPSKKTTVLNDFRKKYLKLTREYANLDELSNESWKNIDAFVVGSDQVWNPRFLRGDKAFMLSFAPTNKSRYSIASSFATDSLPTELRRKYEKELSQFKAISVREVNGVDIIQKELSIVRPVEVILDPTLLLSKKDWMSLIPRSKFIKQRPYILFYMWAYAFEPRPYIYEVVKHYKQKMNCEVIALEGFTSSNRAHGLDMQKADASTISEFIDLFANADLVVTSSFHGTAFALNFGCPLISIVPDNAGDDRQTTLLKSVGAESSVVTIGTDIHSINPYYNSSVLTNLDNIRQKNLTWIRKNIK